MASIMGEFAAVCWANGNSLSAPTIFDRHFMGRPMSIAKWLGWALQVQFVGFSNASDSDKAQGEPSAAASGAGPLV